MPPTRAPIWIYAALFLATFVVYFPVRSHDFVNFDDPDYVTANPHVREGVTPSGIAWAFTSTESANWFPVTRLSQMLDVQLFGLDAGWHHLDNVLLHALAALFLFAFLNRATGAQWPSAFVAFIFALHPLHVESVAWIAERKDVLAALFGFSALWAYARYAQKPSPGRYFLVLALFGLGLMSKPMLVTFPFVLLLVDLWPLRRPIAASLVREKIPFFALAAASGIVTYLAQSGSGAVDSLTIPFSLRLENALASYAIYVRQTIWPSGLAVFYPYPPTVPIWQPVAAALLILAASAASLRTLKTRPYLAVGWFWFLGTLLPVIGLIQVGAQARADRYTYIPMVGLLIIFAWAVPLNKATSVVAVVACAAATMLTWQQIQYWKDSESLFEHALASTERNDIAQHNLGSFLMTVPGRNAEAIPHLEAAVSIRPNSPKTLTDLGTAYSNAGRFPEAVREYQAALSIATNLAITHNNLGNTFLKLDQLPEAIAEYQAALRIDPQYEDARLNLARTQSPAVMAEQEYNQGLALAKSGQPQEAIPHFEAALRLHPNYSEAHNNLGVVLNGSPEAVQHFEEALRIRPNYADAHVNLAVALSNIPGRLPEAIKHLQQAQRIKPDPEIQQMLNRLQAGH